MGVVQVALLFIGKDFVGLLNRLELGFGIFALVFGDLVGVVGQCCLYPVLEDVGRLVTGFQRACLVVSLSDLGG